MSPSTRGERWTHRWRRTLLEHADELSDVLDARFPVFPETKDFSYDAVEVLNALRHVRQRPRGSWPSRPLAPTRAPPAERCSWARTPPCTATSDSSTARTRSCTSPDDTEDFARVVREAIAEPELLARWPRRGSAWCTSATHTRPSRERSTSSCAASMPDAARRALVVSSPVSAPPHRSHLSSSGAAGRPWEQWELASWPIADIGVRRQSVTRWRRFDAPSTTATAPRSTSATWTGTSSSATTRRGAARWHSRTWSTL